MTDWKLNKQTKKKVNKNNSKTKQLYYIKNLEDETKEERNYFELDENLKENVESSGFYLKLNQSN